MELTHEFTVRVPVDKAWATLLDVERIAPCMPGAQLEEIEGDEFRGIVKVKVGPITAQYKGKATFVEKDESAKRAVLRAEGRDTRGQGNANATITAALTPEGQSTKVSLTTDLTITGRVAQLGRGVLADVSGKLLNEFVQSLESTVLASDGESTAVGAGSSHGNGAGAPADTPTPAPGVRKVDQPAVEPINLLDTAGAPILKRLAPLVAALLTLVLWRRRRARRRAAASAPDAGNASD